MSLDAETLNLPAAADSPAARRDLLFRETPLEIFERWALGTAWVLKPHRIGGLPALAKMWLQDLVAPARGLPHPERALERPSGLCGMVRNLSTPTLIRAYRRGLFPFAHYGPLKWFSPPERCVLFFDEAHFGKNTRRLLRQQRYRVTFDRDFEGVIKACSGRRDGKWHVTWITPRIMRTYAELFDAGHVHSFEVWNADGALVGGGYGMAVGGAFFTESQFSLERDTSKVGFAVLNWHLAKWGFTLNDGKWETAALRDAGFRTIPRAEFLNHLGSASNLTGRNRHWQVEADGATVAAWHATKPCKKKPEPHAA